MDEKLEGFLELEEVNPESFRLQISIDNICDLIKNKQNKLSKTQKIYIKWTQDYFEEISKSLDSILNKERARPFHFTPYLKEVIQFSTGKNPKELTKTEFENLQSRFSSMIPRLEMLKNNPVNFYETKDSKEIYELLDKIKLY